MKIAVVGSRKLKIVDIGKYLPADTDEIVSGGAVGVDMCAEEYATVHGIKFTVFLPDYKRYGRAAPILRNKTIVDYSDKVIVFWDGSSRGTLSVIKYAKSAAKPIDVIHCS